MELLRSHDSTIRGAAASALGSIKQNRIKKALLNLFKSEKNWIVSISIIESLGRLRCFRALKSLVKEMLNAQDSTPHQHSLYVLADFTDSREIYSRIGPQDMEEVIDSFLPEVERRDHPEIQNALKRLKHALATKNVRMRLRSLYKMAICGLKAVIAWKGAVDREFYHRLTKYDRILCACLLLLRQLTQAQIDTVKKEWGEARNILALSAFLRIIVRVGKLQKVEDDAAAEERSASKLIENFKRTDEQRAVKFIHVLVRRGVEVDDELIKILKLDYGFPSLYATEILGRMGSIKTVPALIKGLDRDEWMCEYASGALARIGEPALDALEAYLESKAAAKIYTCYALSMLGGDRALKKLFDLLAKPRGIWKTAIVTYFTDLGDVRAIEPLRKLIHSSPSDGVRVEAEGALLNLCRIHEIKVPELKNLEAKDEESEKRLKSKMTILRSGTRGKSPLADLFEPLEEALHGLEQPPNGTSKLQHISKRLSKWRLRTRK